MEQSLEELEELMNAESVIIRNAAQKKAISDEQLTRWLFVEMETVFKNIRAKIEQH